MPLSAQKPLTMNRRNLFRLSIMAYESRHFDHVGNRSRARILNVKSKKLEACFAASLQRIYATKNNHCFISPLHHQSSNLTGELGFVLAFSMKAC